MKCTETLPNAFSKCAFTRNVTVPLAFTVISGGSRISPRGRQLPGGGRQHTILPNFPKNCMKLKEFGPPGGGHASLAPSTDPPLVIDVTMATVTMTGRWPLRYLLTKLRLHLHTPSVSSLFVLSQKWIQCSPMMLFTHNVKKIKGAVPKNGDTDGACK